MYIAENLRIGDTITLKFTKDVVIGIGQKRIIFADVSRKDGGFSMGAQLSTVSSFVIGDGDEYVDVMKDRDYSSLEDTVIIDFKIQSDQARFIRKGRVIKFKLAADPFVDKRYSNANRNINNLIPPEKSVISRVILNGGAGGLPINSLNQLKTSIGNFFELVDYQPVASKNVPIEVE